MNRDVPAKQSSQIIRGREEVSPKNRLLTFTLACLGGFWGLHRFYTGRFWTGLLMLLTGGGFIIWWIIDVFILLSGRFKDGQGRVLGPPRALQRPPAGHLSAEGRGGDAAAEDDDVDLDHLLDDPLAEQFEELEHQHQAPRGTDGRA